MLSSFKRHKLMTLLCLLLVLIMLISGCAQQAATQQAEAQTEEIDPWPEHEIKLILGFAAGGTGDRYSLLFKSEMEKQLGQKIMIDYKAGAGGQIGYEALFAEEGDGYCIGYLAAPHLNNTIILQDPKYKLEDFYPLGIVGYAAPIFFAKKDSKYNDLTEVIADAKNNPGGITVAVGSLTGEQYLSLVLLEDKTGVKFQTVPTGGGAKVVTGVLGDHYDIGITRGPSLVAVSDEVKCLGILAPERDANFPAMKTFDEQFPDLEFPYVSSTSGLLVRKTLKDEFPERFNKLVDAFKQAATSKEVKEALVFDGMVEDYMDPDEAMQYLKEEYELYNKYKEYMKQ